MKSLDILFSEDGKISMMRVMSFACCTTAISIAIYGVLQTKPDYSGLSILCGTFLGVAFTGKVAQKSIEAKEKASPSSDKGPQV